MLRAVRFLVILTQVSLVSCTFHCIGTCYSGESFPKPQEIVHGQHLKGYSYRNISTDDPKKCYSSCVNDCRCKACQMKDSRCELLVEDHASRPNDFVAESGYVYYELKQQFYKGKSHIVRPGECHNGCCKSNPCMNGGICKEYCDTPQKKFSCKCTKNFAGTICQRKVASCADYLRNARENTPSNGIYTIYRIDSGVSLNVYCDFTTANQAWTLIESFKADLYKTYKTKAFQMNFERTPISTNVNWKDYRLSLSNMKYLRIKSTMFRATCRFLARGAARNPDYLFGYLSDYDIINSGAVSGCYKYAYINVRGKEFFNKTAHTFQEVDKFHFHITPNKPPCTFDLADAESGEEFFGYYYPLSLGRTQCTDKKLSATQWWLGEQL